MLASFQILWDIAIYTVTTDIPKALKRDLIYNIEKRVSGIYLHLL